jgi:hypothetical protein
MGKIIGSGIEPSVSDPQSDSTAKEMGKIIGNGRKPNVSEPESKTTRKPIRKTDRLNLPPIIGNG